MMMMMMRFQVEFSPTKQQLATMVGSIAGHIMSSLSDIQRLPDLLTRSKSNKEVLNLCIHLLIRLQNVQIITKNITSVAIKKS